MRNRTLMPALLLAIVAGCNGPLDVKSSGMFGRKGLYAATPLAPAAELWPYVTGVLYEKYSAGKPVLWLLDANIL